MAAEDFAAGVDSLLPVLTILATGLVTIVGAWITAKMTRKSEQAKIKADIAREKLRIDHEKDLARAEVERGQEATRQERAAALAAVASASAAEEAARANAVAELFFGVVLYIDSQDPSKGDTARFEHYFAERWPAFEVDLRRAIGMLKNGDLRNRLINLVSAATDTEIASYHGSNPKNWASWLMDMGADLSMTASRSEEPDEELLTSYRSFFVSYTEVFQYREELWETQRSERQDVLRDIAKQERE